MSPLLLVHDAGEQPLFQLAAKHVRPCEVLLDVGAGIRPQRMIECKQHVCIEPHGEYADVLQESGFTVVRATGVQALDRWKGQVDTIIAIDVLEHMAREEGERFVLLAKAKARQQVVLFTPLGFFPQDGGDKVDPWGLQGQHWQKHRSGWLPKEFPGWTCLVDKKFNSGAGAFFAIWDADRVAA